MTLPIIGNLNPFDRKPTINPKLPETLSQLSQKWAQFQPYLPEVSPDAANAVFDLDRQRVLRGQRPLGTKDTARALLAAHRGDTITPKPKRNPLNLLGNAAADVSTIAQGVFKLPATLAHEVMELPRFADRVAEGEGNIAQRLLRAPGIRLLPGAFTAANIAGGDFNEIATHPVMTALDLLPGANKLAKGTATAKAVVAATPKGIRPTAPIASLITNRLDETGELSRTRVGQMLDVAAAQTKVGQVAQSTFGKYARAGERKRQYGEESLKEAVIPGAAIDQRFDDIPEVVEHTRRAQKELNAIPGMDDADFRVRVAKMAQLDDLSNATPQELAVIAKAKELSIEREGIVLAHELAKRGPGMGGKPGEIYETSIANELWKKQTNYDRRSHMTSIVDHIAKGTGDVDALLGRAADVLNAPVVQRRFGGTVGATKVGVLEQKMAGALTRKAKVEEIRAISYALDSAGIDGTPIRAVLRKWQINKASNTELLYAIKEVEQIKPPRSADIVESHWAVKGKAKLQAQYTAKALRDEEKTLAKAGRKALPDRFEPLVQEKVRDLARQEWVVHEADATKAARLTELIAHNRFAELPGFDQAWLDKTVKGVAESWQELRDAGADPIFMHHARESQVSQMVSPNITELPSSPKQAKSRVLNFDPYIPDLVVGFTHGGFEILKEHVEVGYLKELRDMGIMKPRSEVEPLFMQRAEQAVGRADPRLASYKSRLDKLVANEWVAFEPEKMGYHWAGKRMSSLKSEDLMIPKYLADNFLRNAERGGLKLSAMFDPVMKVFRTSVLALSPRWHIGNIVSGAILSTAEAGVQQWTHASKAWKMASDATKMTPEGAFEVAPDALYRSVADELRHSYSSHVSTFDDLNKSATVLAGRQAGRMSLEVLGDRWAKGGHTALETSILGKVKGKINQAAEASYAFNQKIDMFYRSMAYLRGEEKALTRGMSKEAAEAAGVELSRNVLQDWAGQTPIERALFRSVFPFYSYISFITRYALRYPIDHPVRASIMNSIANAELDDMAAGLPPRFLGALFFGGTNDKGQKWAFEPGGLNPFKDVGSFLSPIGFIAAMNPAFETILAQAGVKMGKGDPFPELTYNAATGQLEARKPSMIGSFVGNVIPQTQVATFLLGANADLSAQFRRDPDGAWRRLLGAVGVPQPVRRVSIPGEIAREELKLDQAAGLEKSRAYQSGSLESRFPSVAAVLEKVRSMSSAGQLGDYMPTREKVDAIKPTVAAPAAPAAPNLRPNTSPVTSLSV